MDEELTRTLRTAIALHARPLDQFVRRARGFGSRIELCYGARRADGKTVVALLLLGVPAQGEVTLRVSGDDAPAALKALADFLIQPEAPGDAPAARATATAATPKAPAATPAAISRSIAGLVGAPGIGVGSVRWHKARTVDAVPRRRHEAAGAENPEPARISRAVAKARAALQRLCAPEDPFADIFAAQHAILADATLESELLAEVRSGCSAEQAVDRVFGRLRRELDGLATPLGRERAGDFGDLCGRVLDALLEDRGASAAAVGSSTGEPLVLCADELVPSLCASLDLCTFKAAVSRSGGPTSHAAIIARGRGLPLLFVPSLTQEALADGCYVRVDALAGRLDVLESDRALAGDPPATSEMAVSCDGALMQRVQTQHGVSLRANLGAPGDLERACGLGALGCGLLRSELLFAHADAPPSAREQARAYGRVATALSPAPTIVRLFDAGGDKPLGFLTRNPEADAAAPGAPTARGARLLLAHPEVLATQLEALALARAETRADLRAMVPMVATLEELDFVLARADPALPVGAMVEVPAALLVIRELVQTSAFVSIGTNDLSHYLLATDRHAAAAPGGLCAGLFPGLLRAIDAVASAARAQGIECGVCGELAAVPAAALLMTGLGVTALSMSPAHLPRVARSLSQFSTQACAEWARAGLEGGRDRELAAVLCRVKHAIAASAEEAR